MSLKDDIASAINRHSAENGSDTPDFILAEYLTGCLSVFDQTVRAREKWYSRDLDPIGIALDPPSELPAPPLLTRDTDEEQREKNPPRFADLIQRLKGICPVPMFDPDKPLNEKDFIRQLEPTPIGLEAAAALEFILERIECALMHLEVSRDIEGRSMSESDAARALIECMGDTKEVIPQSTKDEYAEIRATLKPREQLAIVEYPLESHWCKFKVGDLVKIKEESQNFWRVERAVWRNSLTISNVICGALYHSLIVRYV